MCGASMLFYVMKCFSVNLKQFAADTVGQIEHGGIDEQIERYIGFIAEALCKPAHQVHQIGALDSERTHVHNHAAQLLSLVAHGMLQTGQLFGDMLGGVRQAAAQDIQLDFNAEESLEDAVVEVAGDTASLAFDGAHAQAAQQKQVLEWRAEMPHHPFQALQILGKMRTPRIGQDQPPYALGIEIQGYAEHGTQAKFLLGLLRKTGQFGKMLAVVTIPAKSGAEAVALIPANAGFGIVKEKDLSFGERQVFRCEALGVAGSYGPAKYALEFAIAESEDPFFAIEDAGQFAEQLAERFGHAFFGLHQGREADEEIMLGSVQAVAVTDER